ncbi:SDR family NAD(P)-dependent oxidoreductase [Legionella jordanis]|uniref:Oxidoreductase dehydrogenase, short chain n=1 Tax=Legionella jordanis TaxID=456 RepID=A0A0W0V9H9_9GAMM|nr:SDR family NAD(P)-dependent oxidoreductase [Legionella jordanis]KTD16281.1 oxidoreductase dehydrogenase, short chain [Legionella jordanis]RMX04505.1 SDR family NAD(P)-dependent oxidoreductase [Legionella jordanis]RMX21052.1 SDR family NAD(P)-dependent oxidoreductase [Legionella jordanis]VEH12262.1 oxidoreductase dehydrogenase, short chain [Legionella jordanis]
MESDQRVAVITGAASGIGLALAQICLNRGFHVVMADSAVTALCDKVEQLSNQSQAEVLGVVCDVTKAESLRHLAKQTYEHFHRIDYLFNNAGISGHLAPIWELTHEHIRKVLDVNLYGVIHGVQAFLPFMFKQERRSHIINMASVYGLCSGSLMSAYAMSKHAIVALSESLYFDLKRLGKTVDVSVVCPSFANTQLLNNSMPLHTDKLHSMVADLVARSRPPEDIAHHIMQEVDRKTFYILPDREVKDYCEKRTEALVHQMDPHQHSLERIIASLSKRAMKEEVNS